MKLVRKLLAVTAPFWFGCSAAAKEPVIGVSEFAAESEPPPPPAPRPKPVSARPTVPDDAVERAALPYHGLRESDREPLSGAELMDELSTADAVCVGESHAEARDHFAELAVLRELSLRGRMSGRKIALGLEMLDESQQPSLDAYAARQIGEQQLLEATDWEKNWGYAFALYRPMLEYARAEGLTLLALNAPRKLARKVARVGLDGLSERERRSLPELNLSDSEHRARFDEAMRDHPPGHGKPDNLYAAQVLWDETMAARAASWSSVQVPTRQIVILAGRGHCARSAIPERMRRRGTERPVSVTPLASGADADLSGFDYAIVFEEDESRP
jgi:uncharacterized iron-regulated protein